MTPSQACRSSSVGALFTLLMVALSLTWSGAMDHAHARETQSAVDQARAPTQAEREALAEELDRWFTALAAARRELPRDTFDPQAIVMEVGHEPEALFAWVRDQTYLVGYRGALRGPMGVLMDRLGNSLDRSLLLAELLHSTGHRVRLARGTLSQEQAAELLAQVRSVPENWLAAAHATDATADIEAALYQKAHHFNIDAEALLLHFRRSQFDAARLAEDAVQRVAEQTEALGGMFDAPPPDEQRHTHELAAMRDHWWVQWRQGEHWIDMDVTLPDAQPGASSRAQATETIAIDRLDGTLPLPSELVHEVVLRVVIEQWQGGGLHEATSLEHTLRPAELFGQQITLAHVPVNWPEDLDARLSRGEVDDPITALQEAAVEQDEWLPVLTVGPRAIWQSSFKADGTINDQPSFDPAEQVAQQTRTMFGAMGGGLAGAPATPEPTQQAHLTATWVEYEIRVPGESPQVIRRSVFDFLGFARRAMDETATFELDPSAELLRAVSLLGETDLLIQVCALSPTFLAELALEAILPNHQRLMRSVQHREGDDEALSTDAAPARPNINPLYSLALARHLWRASASRVYHDRPNILSFPMQPTLDAEGQLMLRIGYDIIANNVAVHRDANERAFSQRLEQGVADTVAEAMLMWQFTEDVRNVSHFMEASFDKPWRAFDVEDLASLPQLGLPAGVQQRIEADLVAGHRVVMPAEMDDDVLPSQIGWWRVSPGDGATLGYIGQGHGGSLTEYTIKLTKGVLPGLGVRVFDHWCETQGRPGYACSPCGVAFIGGAIGLLSVRSALVTWKNSQITAVGFIIGGGLAAESVYSSIMGAGGCIDSIGRQFGGEYWRRVHGE